MGLPKKHIDSLEFARIRSVLEGTLGVAELPRLQDVLATQEGALEVRLEGSRDTDGKSWLHLDVTGKLMLACQRCLGGVEFPVAIRRHLQLMKPGSEWPEDDLEDDSIDMIASSKELLVLDLVEDEVLLALPIVARHESCEAPQTARVVGSEAGVAKRASPFSALAALKKN